ncbi:MAG: copper oxidase [Deltaproteobacteria bacterium]|nr:copper oxidase [Candidatus Zymogenaceae bacterium]
MNTITYVLLNVFYTVTRLLPFSCRTGLVRIGNPDRDSPVLLTCNYHLTVLRVKRAIKGLDGYLLVAKSRGINVWCAACGGHFTHHDVISALKTSGIEKLVDHRNVILPQLAAPGVESVVIKKKTGWRVVWGPVYARDIPAFLENKLTKKDDMRKVLFPLADRFEMATAWAAPMSLIAALIFLPLWRGAVAPLIFTIWGLSLAIFLSFPLYERLLKRQGAHVGFPVILWGLVLLGLVGYLIYWPGFSWPFLLRWGAACLIIILVLTLDLTGSTPTFKSGLHDERLLAVELDKKLCKGAGFCSEVCPRDCFAVDKPHKTASIPRAEFCVRCGACIVQCPFDALCFKSAAGDKISPETVRRYKLNLMGKRNVSL